MKNIRWFAFCSFIGAFICTPSVDAGPSLPCLKTIVKQCASIHHLVNPNRVCDFGTLTVACGDVVLIDANVNDIAGTGPGESGRKKFELTGFVNITVMRFQCGSQSSQTCNYLGIHQLSCQGRQADEDSNSCSMSEPPA